MNSRSGPDRALREPETRVLLTQLRRIGDVMMTTPSVRALKEAYPQARFSFLTEAPSDQVLRDNPYLDEVLVYPPGFGPRLRLVRELRRRRFAVAVDFFGNPRSAQLVRMSGAGLRIGFAFRGRRHLYTQSVAPSPERVYAAVDKARLLEPLGVTVSSWELDFPVGEAERVAAGERLRAVGVAEGDRLVTLSPVSRQPYKVWPPERFAQVADRLVREAGAKVLFLYGPGEEHFVEAVGAAMRETALPDLGIPSLRELRALFESVDVHVGNDNGMKHIAAAAGTPTVAVFGRPWAVNWTPPGAPLHRALEFDPGCKSACRYPECKLECLSGVETDTVWQAAREALDSLERESSC